MLHLCYADSVVEATSLFMQLEWSILPRGDIHPASSRVYVSLNRKGEIVLNSTAWQRTGAPEAFQILFNRANNLVALRPADIGTVNAYPARKRGRRDARIVRAYRLLNEFDLRLPDTVEFPDAEIDRSGQLVLDLRTARVSPRAHSQCRKG